MLLRGKRSPPLSPTGRIGRKSAARPCRPKRTALAIYQYTRNAPKKVAGTGREKGRRSRPFAGDLAIAFRRRFRETAQCRTGATRSGDDMKPPSLTIGIEEEYQIIDPNTRELRSYITQILDEGKLVLREAVKAELHQSMVEVGTEVCKTAAEARAELVRLRKGIIELAGKHGQKIAAAGTHPFSSWIEQEITPFERYLGVWKDMRDLAHQLLIFGTHVHIGIEDKDFLIDCMNVARYFAPHVLALSSSSPFWMGRDTGLKSYRSIIFRHFPRSGIPPTLHSWNEYSDYVNVLVRTKSIPDGTKIWWDVRPNWRYPTLEFRICDVCTRVDEAVCVAAIFQAIVAKLWKLRRDNLTFRHYPTALIEENKWRAVRYGIGGNLLDLGRQEERPAKHLIVELLSWFLNDVVDDLGSRTEVEYALNILESGTSADRQLANYQKTGDLKAVVDQLIAETANGVV
jgi:carboxylate-amine ligase